MINWEWKNFPKLLFLFFFFFFGMFIEFAQLSLRARLILTTSRSRKSLTSPPAKRIRGPSPSWTRGLTSYLSCWTLTRRSGRRFSTARCSAAASASRRSWAPAASASRSASTFTATPAWLNTSRSRSGTETFSALIALSPSAPPWPHRCRWRLPLRGYICFHMFIFSVWNSSGALLAVSKKQHI